MILRVVCIVYLLLAVNVVYAETLIDTAKLINIYKKHFDQAIAADLYASPAENQAAKKLRERILDYGSTKDPKLTPDEIDKRWKEYIASEFRTEEAFKLKLKNSYMNEEFVKQKFIQNQYFNNYFQIVTSKRIEEDINNRYKILELAQKQTIEITPTQIEETRMQMIQNWGGDARFESFVKLNNLTPDEITFFIKSDLAKEAIIDKILTSDLEKNSEFASSMKSAIYNHFHNFNETQSPDYYFTQVFIAKEVPDAKLKIEAMHKEAMQKKSLNINADPNILVVDMKTPVNIDSNLYMTAVKQAVLKLGNNGLVGKNAISPIVSTDQGYHFFQLTDIEIPESLSYDSAKTLIYKKIKTQKARDFNSLFADLLK